MAHGPVERIWPPEFLLFLKEKLGFHCVHAFGCSAGSTVQPTSILHFLDNNIINMVMLSLLLYC